MWNSPLAETLDTFETSTCENTQAGLQFNGSCLCGQGIHAVEPWQARTPGESNVIDAFKKAPAPLQAAMAYARGSLQSGSGFSQCVIDTEGTDPTTGEKRPVGKLLFCLFVKCPVCQQIVVMSEDVSKVRSFLGGR